MTPNRHGQKTRITNIMELSSCWYPGSSLAGQQIPHLLRNQKSRRYVHKSWNARLHIFFVKMYLNIIHPSTPRWVRCVVPSGISWILLVPSTHFYGQFFVHRFVVVKYTGVPFYVFSVMIKSTKLIRAYWEQEDDDCDCDDISCVNPLKHSGRYTYHLISGLKKSAFSPRNVFICLEWLSQQRATFSLSSDSSL
jgi:hypothetical protein